MRAKSALLTMCVVFFALGVSAVVKQFFQSWESLITHSPDIVLATCSETPARSWIDERGFIVEHKDGLLESRINVYMSLKGNTNTGPGKMFSEFWPRQGEHYLIFARYDYGRYQAIEPYRIVPLGMSFPTNMIAGQPLEDQVRTILKWRLDRLNREIAEEQDEVKRLESGLKSR